jgi:hypothetical protein
MDRITQESMYRGVLVFLNELATEMNPIWESVREEGKLSLDLIRIFHGVASGIWDMLRNKMFASVLVIACFSYAIKLTLIQWKEIYNLF